MQNFNTTADSGNGTMTTVTMSTASYMVDQSPTPCSPVKPTAVICNDADIIKESVEYTSEVIKSDTEIKTKCIRDEVSPLNATRLRPIKQQTRTAIIHILESGEVCLQFLKHRQSSAEIKVNEMFTISPDGETIKVYVFRQEVPVADDPSILQQAPTRVFKFDQLPVKYWRKYKYAAR
ncbi:hypothetical protein KUTeg_024347 [Tegillarca granosa]|uniref:Cryptic POLO box 1 (CPB1) domain-containing protein n=1 Tax=Tegillarca granosa TaxID=220873 RepID=A0ABQ9DX38_TEGGR|nr:hypothetical protein KUTeg_024347 [Tegillarca granosa]